MTNRMNNWQKVKSLCSFREKEWEITTIVERREENVYVNIEYFLQDDEISFNKNETR